MKVFFDYEILSFRSHEKPSWKNIPYQLKTSGPRVTNFFAGDKNSGRGKFKADKNLGRPKFKADEN